MGIMDDMSTLIGRGMNAADKKTQTFRLQADLSQATAAKEQALANLGRAVYASGLSDPTYADQIREIAQLDAKEAALAQQVMALQGGAGGAMRSTLCPTCNNPVSLDSPRCPTCGDNLASLKAQYRMCPQCHSYYSADFAFCEMCGVQTVKLPIAALGESHNNKHPGLPAQDSRCPVCHEMTKPGAVFCGACGTRL